MQRKPIDPHPIILQMLSEGTWHAPHEVNLILKLCGCHVSPEATTARMRDLRKVKFGQWDLKKRIRKGTEYYEYRVIGPIETASKAA